MYAVLALWSTVYHCAGAVLFGVVFAVSSCAASYQDVVSNCQPSLDNLDAHMCLAIVDCDVSFGCCNIHSNVGVCQLGLSCLLDEGAEMQSTNQRSLG